MTAPSAPPLYDPSALTAASNGAADGRLFLTPAGKRIRIMTGDITALAVDAIVNSAKPSLMGGYGVDGAIHRAAGPGLFEECRRIPEPCPVGSCRMTGAYALPCRRILHAVGPRWLGGGHGEEEALERCCRTALDIALKEGFRTVAFPCISAGVHRFPLPRAAAAMLRAIASHPWPGEAIVCCYTPEERRAFEDTAEALFGGS